MLGGGLEDSFPLKNINTAGQTRIVADVEVNQRTDLEKPMVSQELILYMVDFYISTVDGCESNDLRRFIFTNNDPAWSRISQPSTVC